MTTKTLASSLALLAASSMFVAQADSEPVWDPSRKTTTMINAVGFENFTLGTTPATTMADDGTTDSSKAYFLYQGTGEDGSVVTNHGTFAYAGNVPAYFSTFSNNKFLSLSTEGGTLFRSLNILDTTGGTPALGDVQAITDALYVDTLVQFTPCDSDPDVGSENKLAVWLSVTNDVTNICVRAGYWDYANSVFTQTPKTYTLANTSAINVEAGEWVRLTVKAIKNVYTGNQYEMPAFQVYINDTLAEFNEPVASAAAIALQTAAGETLSAKTTLPSMQIAATLQAVGFQGTGAVDDFVVTTDKPGFLAVDFTLIWDANIAGLEVFLNGDEDPYEGINISSFTNVFANMVAGQYIEISKEGNYEGATAAASGYAIDWENTILSNVQKSEASNWGYRFTAVGDGPYSVQLVTRSTGPAPINFDLTWPAGLTAVSYTINGGTPVAITGASPLAISGLADGDVVSFTFQNADGATKTVSATVADGTVNGIDATGTTFGWADYLGDAVNGAYEIDNLAELKLFQKGIAITTNELKLATAGETFKLTADITLDAAWPGIGVQNGKDIYSTADFNAAAFQGTFDGQNHTISGFQMVGGGLDYCGFFNSTYGATIQNLKIAYAGGLFAADTTQNSSLESGATFVGVAKNSTLRNLTTVAGTVACDKGFGGIVGYLTSGSLVDSCTNNVNMTSLKPNKCGGIAMITQGGSAVTICNCQNNGTIAGSNETGSLVGYIGLNTTIENCDSTVAYKLFHHQTETVTVSGITANATVAAYSGAATPGLNFATVDGDVATFVADNALALNGSYKVMGPSATATATFEFTALGTIAFDETLSTPTYAITSSGAAGIPVASTSGTVTTYTAGYFPRTATAGQDGSASNPFEIADEDDLQALQAAVANNVGKNLAYVQVADIALTAAWPGIGPDAGKDLSAADYEAGAFAGTYDGGNYTISNFQMVNGVDYGALFNTVLNATIKNLKISWGSSTLCANSSSSGDDTGASFVGTAKGSTLQNLTALAGTVTTVTASKDMAGIVGFVYAGSTIESCTNELNVTSFKTSRKCGGIAVITQNGSGNAIFRNCYNSGTVTTPGTTYREGGIVGYVNVATTIDGCENTANVKLFHVEGSPTVTVTGTNKGYAGVASNDKGVSGLYFATVDGNVATFVADNALALNGSYKVMSAGATATFAFAEAGTIAFDTALFTPTYAITAGSGLTLKDPTTSGTVTTYEAESNATPLEPGQQDATTYNDIAAASNAAAKVEIAVPTAVTAEGISAETYKALFEAKVVSNGTGGYNVVVDLKDEVVADLEDQAEDDIADVAAVLTTSATEATLKTTPGLYYSFQYGYSVNGMNYNTASVLAAGTSTSLAVPAKAQTAGFYKLVITTTPRAATEPKE